MEIVIYDSNSTSGYYFLLPYKQFLPFPYDHPLLILDHFGRMVYYQVLPGNSAFNFNLNPNDMMSYYDPVNETFWLMDSTFYVVDSLKTMNGFDPDPHEFLIAEDNHRFILSKETRVMDLSAYYYFGINNNQPGSSTAQVIGAVIQEFDENNNLVWEWKAHDHYAFGDVTSIWLRNAYLVDWTHANAIEQDNDGNILISLRHFNEITKINHQTGEIIWRMGGKSNQFTFTNDIVGFTGQHDIRRIDNGHITLLDNGQYNAFSMARAVEYSLDESTLTATLEWEYVYDSSIYSSSLGNHQVLANGNHLIDFGTLPAEFPWMVVVKQDKSKVLELDCPDVYISYRAYNYDTLPWQLNRPQVDCIKIGDAYLLEAEPGHPEYRWSTGAKTQSIPITNTGIFWVFVPYGEGYISSEHFTITDMSDPCLYLPDEIHLEAKELDLKISPNPVTHRATVEFHIPELAHGMITLIDMTGRSLGIVSGNPFPPGDHRINLNAFGLHEGLYFISLEIGIRRIIKKVVIL
ncbi:MAG: aryl-sulfate sulfotransferase [Bacteroidia bacterium]|nr:aryl-sulfate sulfotransferase [Bacteroidia bacterium]